jgi:hypothetical protein
MTSPPPKKNTSTEVNGTAPVTTSSPTKNAGTLGATKKPFGFVEFFFAPIIGISCVFASVAGNEHIPSNPVTFAAKVAIGTVGGIIGLYSLKKYFGDIRSY